MKYKIAIHKSDEGFSVSVPGLPGCWSQGTTEPEALENIRDMEVPMLLPGITVSISRADHGPIKSMQMLRFNGSAWETVGPLVSRK